MHCVGGCENDRDCPGDLFCAADLGAHGTCVECLQDGDCAADQVCYGHACTFACSSDADCAEPLPVCDPHTGACVTCLAKDDCPLGHLCQGGVCVPGCESTRDCPEGQECQAGQCQGQCVPSGSEQCDGIDNDCDGRTDADDPQLILAPCELTDGICVNSHHLAAQCSAGSWQTCGASEYGPLFGPETCDGLDTDCNGVSDDGLQLDCQDQYVCDGDSCVYTGGCTHECGEGSTDCTIWDSSIVYVCGNTDADPCREWVTQDCPLHSYCDSLIFNECICENAQCNQTCCAPNDVCGPNGCCSPTCPARTCGPDGCGGMCACEETNDQCIDGVCVCTPSCGGKPCGDDGCGGSCPNTCVAGTHCEGNQCICDFTECQNNCCADGQVCSLFDGGCCDPQCEGVECGPDGCGHDCGACQANELCQSGTCVCQPDCGGMQCGDDGCGGSCGSCPNGQTCDGGQCCTPNCGGLECGDDGCSGSCGYCGSAEECDLWGQCQCAYDNCAGTCCEESQTCYNGSCCEPDCGGGLYNPFHCDSDGCGGTCVCSEHAGPGSECENDLTCGCPPPGFECATLLSGTQCCDENQQCDFWIFGCY